jgi:hypothetical protein
VRNEKAKGLRGMRLLVLLVPRLDGWRPRIRHRLRGSRLSGVFLPRSRGRQPYSLNAPQKSRPVRDYLRAQRRYAHLEEHEIEALQREVDTGWARLQRRAQVAAAEITAAA